MRIVRFGAALALACYAGAGLAGTPDPAMTGQAVAPPATSQGNVAPDTPASVRLLVTGIPVDASGKPADVQAIVAAAYRDALAALGHPATPDATHVQAVLDAVTRALRQAGYADAKAYLPRQLVTVELPVAASASAAAPSPSPSVAATPPPPPAPAGPPGSVVPPVRDRGASSQSPSILVSGFAVQGVGEHPEYGVTPATIQALADAAYGKLASSSGQPVRLSFAQMTSVADAITQRYRTAGFIVANAFLPAQTIGDDRVVRISVLEGKIGRIIVKGTRHYRPGAIAAPASHLEGKPLVKSEVDSALLYASDLPGVSVSSTFQPGEHTGETDLVMVANESRPVQFTLGGNNYGTELTGRYRARAGLIWNSPLGFGDQFNANVDYALNPSNNVYGSLTYNAPLVVVPGLSMEIGASRDELQINTGSFAALDVKGPSQTYYLGSRWKFVNTNDLKMYGALHYLREQSKLSSLGMTLSDEQFDVAELKWGMTRTDRRLRGVDLLEVGVRQSIHDRSMQPDLVAPLHASNFLVAQLSYTRLQFLTKSQRLYFKFSGQYTNDALVPLEQFAMGGPTSVRAYPIADALRDRGYYASLEYHVDAPGFGDVASPFYGRPWRELLEFEAFVDYARGFSAGANSNSGAGVSQLSGVGAGLIFRLPQFNHFEFHLDGSVSVSSQNASDDRGYHIYSRFSFTF